MTWFMFWELSTVPIRVDSGTHFSVRCIQFHKQSTESLLIKLMHFLLYFLEWHVKTDTAMVV